jgi:hypothetical protein
MKYIFVAGAPGSKWSSVIKNIYYSADIDRSDFTHARTYYHDASGHLDLMHLGSYFDPGMEFGDWFNCINEYSQEECEQEFDRPFSGRGIRIIRSHVFAHHIDFLRRNWPDCPIILVHRADDACLGWWVRCGHFDITYPDYSAYYKNLRVMAERIDRQNGDISMAWRNLPGMEPANSHELCDLLGIACPTDTSYKQIYEYHDVSVKVLGAPDAK